MWHRENYGDEWSKRDKELMEFYNNRPYETLYVDGNHENFDVLNRAEISERFGGHVNKIGHKVTHLRRGEIYNIDGKKIWVFGGATSIDKHMRIEGINWWPDEIATYSEMEHGIKQLESIGNKVDYIITHNPPDKVVRELMSSSVDCPVTKYLNYILETVKYKEWFCGHMHIDKYLKEYSMKLLYNDIIKLK